MVGSTGPAEPTPAESDSADHWTADTFERWLVEGFERHAAGDGSAFPPGVLLNLPAVPQVCSIFDDHLTSDRARDAFLRGLDQALWRFPDGRYSTATLEQLVYLASRLGACSTCNSIWACVRHLSRQPRHERTPASVNARALMIGLLADWSRQQAVRPLALALLNDPAVDERYLPLILLRLVEGQPGQASDLVRTFRHRAGTSQAAAALLKPQIPRLVDVMGLALMRDLIMHLDLTGPESDAWLLDLLISGEEAPLRVQMVPEQDLPDYVYRLAAVDRAGEFVELRLPQLSQGTKTQSIVRLCTALSKANLRYQQSDIAERELRNVVNEAAPEALTHAPGVMRDAMAALSSTS